MSGDAMAGCRVLVVEDEALIAMMIEDALTELGCEIVGLTGELATALRLAREEELGVAILDVSIRDEKIYPVAEELQARGIPFLLASGYGDWALPENLRNKPRLTKPFTPEELVRRVRVLCMQPAAAHRA